MYIKKRKPIVITDFTVTNGTDIDYIEWKEIERVMKKTRYNEFLQFMNGQTCFKDGVFVCDVENFLRKKQDRFFD